MSREFDDIRKKIDQSHKELYKQDAEIGKDINDVNKNQIKMTKEIADIKKQVKDISFKVDLMLEILNNFTIMLSEEEEYEEDYDLDQSWVPEEDEWSNGEDDS